MHYEYLNEVWKGIKGYEGMYQVSNYGRVLSLHYNNTNKPNFLKPVLNKTGYLTVCISGKIKSVHRLVAEAFLPNPNNLPCVNHKDENPQNNFVDNLEWCSYSYNNDYGSNTQRIRGIKRLNNIKQSKPVLQYDIDGNFIKEWPSLIEIKRKTGYSFGNISNVCLNKPHYNTAYGYIWKFKRDVV